MPRRNLIIKTFSYLLAIYFTSEFWVYLQMLQAGDVSIVAIFLLFLYSVLITALVAAALLKKWSRQILVPLNMFFSFYLLYFLLQNPNFVSPTTIFLHMICVFFFNNLKIKEGFDDVKFQRRKILIIDDDVAMQRMLHPALVSQGFEHLEALTGEEGIDVALHEQPDIIILDVILPKMKGREVCVKIKRNPQTRNIPILFLTAKDSPDDVKAELEAGAVGHITKPINPQHLVNEIKEILRKKNI